MSRPLLAFKVHLSRMDDRVERNVDETSASTSCSLMSTITTERMPIKLMSRIRTSIVGPIYFCHLFTRWHSSQYAANGTSARDRARFKQANSSFDAGSDRGSKLDELPACYIQRCCPRRSLWINLQVLVLVSES